MLCYVKISHYLRRGPTFQLLDSWHLLENPVGLPPCSLPSLSASPELTWRQHPSLSALTDLSPSLWPCLPLLIWGLHKADICGQPSEKGFPGFYWTSIKTIWRAHRSHLYWRDRNLTLVTCGTTNDLLIDCCIEFYNSSRRFIVHRGDGQRDMRMTTYFLLFCVYLCACAHAYVWVCLRRLETALSIIPQMPPSWGFEAGSLTGLESII